MRNLSFGEENGELMKVLLAFFCGLAAGFGGLVQLFAIPSKISSKLLIALSEND